LICGNVYYRTQSETRDPPHSDDAYVSKLQQYWRNEAEALQRLDTAYDELESDRPFKPFPSLIWLAEYKQENDFAVPGGFLIYLVMEKLQATACPKVISGSGRENNVILFEELLNNQQSIIPVLYFDIRTN
jgi:hypothetical protein